MSISSIIFTGYKAGWTTGCIGFKYLKIVRSVIEQDDMSELSKEPAQPKTKKKKNKGFSLSYAKNKIYFYEVVSKAMQQILSHVNNNFSKKKVKTLSTCEEEIYIISEIAKCCKLIIEKISLIKFIPTSEEDLKSNFSKLTHV